MYRLIEQRRSVRKLYMERLVNTRELSVEEGEALLEEYRGLLEEAFAETKDMVPAAFEPSRSPPAKSCPPRCRREQLVEIAQRVSTPPEGFTVHPKLTKLLDERARDGGHRAGRLGDGRGFRHRLALAEGHWVRLTGEDSQRGTFSHRHAALTDYQTGADWVPLQSAPGEFPGADRRLAALRVRRRRLRVRLLGGDPRRPGDVGGAVRRLRQRRPGGDRPVHLRRGATSGASAAPW